MLPGIGYIINSIRSFCYCSFNIQFPVIIRKIFMPIKSKLQAAYRFKFLAVRFFSDDHSVGNSFCIFLFAFKYELPIIARESNANGLSLRLGPPLHTVCSFN